MYVIATVICPNFHFSVSLHVPFLNLLFEQIANSNEYFLAKFGFDTTDNEPNKTPPEDLIFTYIPRTEGCSGNEREAARIQGPRPRGDRLEQI